MANNKYFQEIDIQIEESEDSTKIIAEPFDNQANW